MNDIPLGALFVALALLIACSGFFSGSETGLMTLNRYRLRHLVKTGHPGAVRANRLLQRPDRLIGLILLGNNFVNILASALATVIAIRLIGDAGIPIAAALLTVVILIFAEVTPKTIAALRPERFAFPASIVLAPMLRLLYPFVWVVNGAASIVLKPLGLADAIGGDSETLSREELRTVLMEAGVIFPGRHQRMLLSILDLEAITVEDIMVPRNEVVAIDLDEDWDDIVEQLQRTAYARLPVYRGTIDQISGVIHVRRVLRAMAAKPDFDRGDLDALIREPYFVPEGTPLSTQLIHFQQQHRRMGLVVNEYGDLQGIVTLEDLLEEIVGEFTTDPSEMHHRIVRETDGSYLIDGGTTLRGLNRALGWALPTEGPKTLNGAIMEYLETIPAPGTTILLAGHPTEIVKISENRVKTVRMHPALAGIAPRRGVVDQ